MAIRFHCLQCNQGLSIANRKAGHIKACPVCGLEQVIPAVSGDSPSLSSTSCKPEKSEQVISAVSLDKPVRTTGAEPQVPGESGGQRFGKARRARLVPTRKIRFPKKRDQQSELVEGLARTWPKLVLVFATGFVVLIFAIILSAMAVANNRNLGSSSLDVSVQPNQEKTVPIRPQVTPQETVVENTKASAKPTEIVEEPKPAALPPGKPVPILPAATKQEPTAPQTMNARQLLDEFAALYAQKDQETRKLRAEVEKRDAVIKDLNHKDKEARTLKDEIEKRDAVIKNLNAGWPYLLCVEEEFTEDVAALKKLFVEYEAKQTNGQQKQTKTAILQRVRQMEGRRQLRPDRTTVESLRVKSFLEELEKGVLQSGK